MARTRWRRRWHGARQRFSHSLKRRLVGLFLVLALATTVIFVGGLRGMLRGGWQDYGRPLITHYIDLLAAQIGTPPDVARAQALSAHVPLSIRITGPQVNWDSHPEQRRRWPPADPGWDSGERDWLHVRTLADGHRISFGLAAPATALRPRFAPWATLGMLLVLTWLAYAYVRRLLRPLDDIRAGAVRFGQGDFAHRIPLRRHDELGDLAQQVNTMAGDIQHMLDAKRGLLLAISHELRSPLTRARVNAELIESSEARDALLRDLALMRDLVIDLLESERLAAGHAALQREPTDLNAMVRETLASQFADRRVAAELAPALPPLALDRVRVRLLLRNLLDNALRHSAEAAQPPVVRTSLEGDTVVLTVRDHGPGVPEEHLAQLTQPFYRADVARQRATGGVGLGLYLCRLVAQAHDGNLSIANAHPGLEVSVSLPALPAGSD